MPRKVIVKQSTVTTLMVSATLAVLTVLVLKSPKAGLAAENVPAGPKTLAPRNQQSAVNRTVQTVPAPTMKTNHSGSN
jgi:hypothetical protein